MAAATPTTPPERLTQGDTHEWTRSLPDYPADDGWTLTYYWVQPDGAPEVTLAAVQDGSTAGYRATIAAATAALFTELGTYLWREVVTKAAETITVGRGRLEILDPLTGSTDRRLWLEKMVAALEAKSEGRATAQQLSYSIDNRSLSLMSLTEVLDVRDRLLQELEGVLAEEARENGHTVRRRVRTRLGG